MFLRMFFSVVMVLVFCLHPAAGAALPHTVFRDSHLWVTSPNDLTPAGPYAWALPELDVASAWELVEGYPSSDEAVCIAVPRHGEPCIYGTFHTAPEFRPDAPITRAEYAAILIRATGTPLASSGTVPFTDVAPDGWYRPYVAALVRDKVLTLEDGNRGLLDPDGPITRLELAVWATRAVNAYRGSPDAGDLSAFADAGDVPERLWADMAGAVGLGIIKGYPQADGTMLLLPNGSARRVEATAMLVRTVRSFNQRPPAATDLEVAVRDGLATYYRTGQSVFAAGGKHPATLTSYVLANQAVLEEQLRRHFTVGVVAFITDKRGGISGTYATRLSWGKQGYSIMDDLLRWTNYDVRDYAVLSVTPILVLDRYATVQARVMVLEKPIGPDAIRWTFNYEVDLKREANVWKIGGIKGLGGSQEVVRWSESP